MIVSFVFLAGMEVYFLIELVLIYNSDGSDNWLSSRRYIVPVGLRSDLVNAHSLVDVLSKILTDKVGKRVM